MIIYGTTTGFGGKVEANESIAKAAMRELEEEACIRGSNLIPHGTLLFTFKSRPEVMNVHVFCTSDFQGKVTESEEMLPKWYSASDIPFEQMWADDKYWLPHVLDGKAVKGTFHFDDESTILNYDLEVFPFVENSCINTLK